MQDLKPVPRVGLQSQETKCPFWTPRGSSERRRDCRLRVGVGRQSRGSRRGQTGVEGRALKQRVTFQTHVLMELQHWQLLGLSRRLIRSPTSLSLKVRKPSVPALPVDKWKGWWGGFGVRKTWSRLTLHLPCSRSGTGSAVSSARGSVTHVGASAERLDQRGLDSRSPSLRLPVRPRDNPEARCRGRASVV